jgi:hypothetical protein
MRNIPIAHSRMIPLCGVEHCQNMAREAAHTWHKQKPFAIRVYELKAYINCKKSVHDLTRLHL